MLLWGRLVTCGGLATRLLAVCAAGPARPFANRPQDANLSAWAGGPPEGDENRKSEGWPGARPWGQSRTRGSALLRLAPRNSGALGVRSGDGDGADWSAGGSADLHWRGDELEFVDLLGCQLFQVEAFDDVDAAFD